jgi:hypothetical protein
VDPDEQDPYLNEWNDLMEAIRNDKPYNEVKRGVEASLVTSMGRMAAHTGQEITFEQMLNHEHEYAPGADKLTMDSPAPLLANPDLPGTYVWMPDQNPGVVAASLCVSFLAFAAAGCLAIARKLLTRSFVSQD